LACAGASHLAAADAPREELPAGIRVLTRLTAEPAQVELKNRFDYRQLLITAELSSGEQIDVTRMATIEPSANLVQISPAGLVRPATDGAGSLKVTFAGQTLEIPVTVLGTQEGYHASFVQDVMPAMSKLGCNAGTCHGAAQGKNGFKLSLRGYDPAFDYQALTDDHAGRRFNRAAPDSSLMLLKPSGRVPHVGGMLMKPGEPNYELLRDWIASGVPLDLDKPRVAKIEVFPKEPTIPLPGMKQQMIVLATYSDGRVRDVTAEAFVESSLSEVAEVDKTCLATAVRRGEAAMLARYEGAYAAVTLTVMGDRSGFEWKQPLENNFIDELVDQKLKKRKILPSDPASDADFLRRIYLDLTGVTPSPETVRAFLADTRDARLKRDEVIDRLVGSTDYVEHWTNKWADLLQVNRKFLSEKGAWALRNWINKAVAANVPYDQFVYTVLTAGGSTFENPPAAYLRTLREPDAAMENSTQLFLGVRFNCNKCHDHPFERWTQDQYYKLSAFFAQVGRKAGDKPEEEVIYDTTVGEVMHPTSGKAVAPSFPYSHADLAAQDVSRREQFARWVTSRENQYFAKSFVNRMWAYLLGIGLIEPIDDIRAGNPPSNPALLDRLTQEFIQSDFDVQHLVKLIVKSQTYQRSLETNQWNVDDQINYAHAVARRLSAEVLYDAVARATGTPEKLPGLPAGYRANQLADANVAVPGGFFELFGRPPRESACECERNSGVALGQTLTLVNGPVIADAIAGQQNRLAQLVASQPDDSRLVDDLFVAILCRPPTAAELQTGLTALREGGDRLSGAQDLAWALINSPAFLFNH